MLECFGTVRCKKFYCSNLKWQIQSIHYMYFMFFHILLWTGNPWSSKSVSSVYSHCPPMSEFFSNATRSSLCLYCEAILADPKPAGPAPIMQSDCLGNELTLDIPTNKCMNENKTAILFFWWSGLQLNQLFKIIRNKPFSFKLDSLTLFDNNTWSYIFVNFITKIVCNEFFETTIYDFNFVVCSVYIFILLLARVSNHPE